MVRLVDEPVQIVNNNVGVNANRCIFLLAGDPPFHKSFLADADPAGTYFL
jgi:hypothetical protein